VPRSNPDGFSVNANCIDSDTIEELTVRDTDGRNWEATHAKGVWADDSKQGAANPARTPIQSVP
jgi:hypothetical protein